MGFGYLKTLPRSNSIPDECLICSKLADTESMKIHFDAYGETDEENCIFSHTHTT